MRGQVVALVYGFRALGEPRSTFWPSWRRQVQDLDMQSSVRPKCKARYHVGNWPTYDRALVQRGAIPVWLAPDATATWEAVGVGTRGGQLQYSDLAIEAALPLNEKGTLSKNAIAEGIINNVRKIIIREQLTDPRFYEQMSKLLDDLIKQNRADATAYEEFLRMVEPLVKRLAGKQSDEGVPASLYGKREARVIYNNLPRILAAGRARADRAAEESPEYGDERVRLALEIDQVMRERAPAGWKGDQAREDPPRQTMDQSGSTSTARSHGRCRCRAHTEDLRPVSARRGSGTYIITARRMTSGELLK